MDSTKSTDIFWLSEKYSIVKELLAYANSLRVSSYNVIDELGFFELSETELADADIKKEIDGYEYWVFSNDRWGNFEISPVDPDN